MKILGITIRPFATRQPKELQPIALKKEVSSLEQLLDAASRDDIKETEFTIKKKRTLNAKAGISAHTIVDNIGASGAIFEEEEIICRIVKK